MKFLLTDKIISSIIFKYSDGLTLEYLNKIDKIVNYKLIKHNLIYNGFTKKIFKKIKNIDTGKCKINNHNFNKIVTIIYEQILIEVKTAIKNFIYDFTYNSYDKFISMFNNEYGEYDENIKYTSKQSHIDDFNDLYDEFNKQIYKYIIDIHDITVNDISGLYFDILYHNSNLIDLENNNILNIDDIIFGLYHDQIYYSNIYNYEIFANYYDPNYCVFDLFYSDVLYDFFQLCFKIIEKHSFKF